jgi:hypothetical protein
VARTLLSAAFDFDFVFTFDFATYHGTALAVLGRDFEGSLAVPNPAMHHSGFSR